MWSMIPGPTNRALWHARHTVNLMSPSPKVYTAPKQWISRHVPVHR